MSDDLDRRLKDFLDACESERALGKTNEAILTSIARVVDNQAAHEKSDVERFAAMGSRLDQHHFRIGSLEERASKVEGRVEDTGKHQIIVAEKRAGRWDNLAWKVFAVVLMGLLGGGIVEFVHRVGH